jgi:hypothetical protein
VVTTIITGVPRCGRDESADDEAPPIAKAPEEKAPRVEDFHARRKVSDALSAVSKPLPRTPAPRPVESSPDEGPYHIHAQVRGPDERGDPGEIAEGSYTISGSRLRPLQKKIPDTPARRICTKVRSTQVHSGNSVPN